MENDPVQGIWPPYEAFYLEGMLYCTTTALGAADEVRVALEYGSQYQPRSREWQDSARVILDGAQTLALQAAALSRYFWPARTKEPHGSRAERLRAGFGVANNSSLRNRELRNALEHFDERLDLFCQTLAAGRILPTYVGPLHSEPEIPTYLFRAYYTNVGVFEVLGERFEMSPILEELEGLHGKLMEARRNGNRIPSPP